jgi:hypothetical protein
MEDKMKKLTVILLLIALLGAGLLTWRNFRDGSDLAEIEKKVEKMAGKQGVAAKVLYKNLLKQKGLDVSAGHFAFAGFVTFLTLLLIFLLLVFTFIKNHKLAFMGSIALLVLTVIMIFVNPSYDIGATGPASARSLAIIIGVITILGSLAALTTAKKASIA